MRIIDLSHKINPNMPVFPGSERPTFEVASSIEVDGFVEKKLTMYSHTGTHLDAPSHMLPHGASLEVLEPNQFFGQAALIDLRHLATHQITKLDLIQHKHNLCSAEFAILHTGWYKKWGCPTYFKDYPCLTEDAVDWLMQFRLKGIGVDTISIDHIDSKQCPIHHMLFDQALVVVENLTNLDQIEVAHFQFACFPLNLQGGDGSPVRAVAMID